MPINVFKLWKVTSSRLWNKYINTFHIYCGKLKYIIVHICIYIDETLNIFKRNKEYSVHGIIGCIMIL